LLFNWIIQNPGITCTLVGSRNIQQLNSNVADTLNKNCPWIVKEELDRNYRSTYEQIGQHLRTITESASNLTHDLDWNKAIISFCNYLEKVGIVFLKIIYIMKVSYFLLHTIHYLRFLSSCNFIIMKKIVFALLTQKDQWSQ